MKAWFTICDTCKPDEKRFPGFLILSTFGAGRFLFLSQSVNQPHLPHSQYLTILDSQDGSYSNVTKLPTLDFVSPNKAELYITGYTPPSDISSTEKKVAPKGKAAKDPNKPKKPASAFFIFMLIRLEEPHGKRCLILFLMKLMKLDEPHGKRCLILTMHLMLPKLRKERRIMRRPWLHTRTKMKTRKELVRLKQPKKLKKKRKLEISNGSAGYQEFIDYLFPEESS